MSNTTKNRDLNQAKIGLRAYSAQLDTVKSGHSFTLLTAFFGPLPACETKQISIIK